MVLSTVLLTALLVLQTLADHHVVEKLNCQETQECFDEANRKCWTSYYETCKQQGEEKPDPKNVMTASCTHVTLDEILGIVAKMQDKEKSFIKYPDEMMQKCMASTTDFKPEIDYCPNWRYFDEEEAKTTESVNEASRCWLEGFQGCLSKHTEGVPDALLKAMGSCGKDWKEESTNLSLKNYEILEGQKVGFQIIKNIIKLAAERSPEIKTPKEKEEKPETASSIDKSPEEQEVEETKPKPLLYNCAAAQKCLDDTTRFCWKNYFNNCKKQATSNPTESNAPCKLLTGEEFMEIVDNEINKELEGIFEPDTLMVECMDIGGFKPAKDFCPSWRPVEDPKELAALSSEGRCWLDGFNKCMRSNTEGASTEVLKAIEKCSTKWTPREFKKCQVFSGAEKTIQNCENYEGRKVGVRIMNETIELAKSRQDKNEKKEKAKDDKRKKRYSAKL